MYEGVVGREAGHCNLSRCSPTRQGGGGGAGGGGVCRCGCAKPRQFKRHQVPEACTFARLQLLLLHRLVLRRLLRVLLQRMLHC